MAATLTLANGLRLLLVARLSRAKVSDRRDGVSIEIQDGTARDWAEGLGHAIVATVADIKSGTVAPWARKNLKPWMTDPAKMAMYDGILIYHTDRISRGTQEDFVFIENWASVNGKAIIVADGPQYPARDDSDYWRWTAEKRVARQEWERIQARSVATQGALKAQGHAVGKPPFGYRVTGAMYAKRFEINPVTGPLAREAFLRISQGRTATSVAEWLTEATGKLWRVKRVIDMIKRETYLGSRDGHVFEALVTQDLWDSANAAQGARSIATGGRRAVHGYSGVVYCQCGAQVYRHQSTRNGRDIGIEHYRCAMGRRGIAGEAKCENPSLPFAEANAAIDAMMRNDPSWPWVTKTTGGDAARQAELARIKADMASAIAQGDMVTVSILAAKYAEIDAMPAQAIKTVTTRRLDKSIGDLWAAGSLTDQRAMLGDRTVTVLIEADSTVRARLEDDTE
jgi:DNA invertase Pin-like site-specific DNA recombinase